MRTTAMSRTAISVTQDRAGNRVSANPLVLVSNNDALNSGALPVHLTPRQLEVLALLCEGLPNKLICRRLNISTGTAKAHISVILRELGVASRLQAVLEAHRLGLDVKDAEATESASRGGLRSVVCEMRQ